MFTIRTIVYVSVISQITTYFRLSYFYDFIKKLKMADAMLSMRDKGSKKGSSSEGKGKSLKKNVCKDDKKVPSEEGPTERVIKDVEKSSGAAGSPSLLSLSGPKTGVASSSRKEPSLSDVISLLLDYSGRTDISEKRHEYVTMMRVIFKMLIQMKHKM